MQRPNATLLFLRKARIHPYTRVGAIITPMQRIVQASALPDTPSTAVRLPEVLRLRLAAIREFQPHSCDYGFTFLTENLAIAHSIESQKVPGSLLARLGFRPPSSPWNGTRLSPILIKWAR